MNKKCRKCGEIKHISSFNPDRMGKYGVASTCYDCKKQKQINDYRPLKITPVNKIGKKHITIIQTRGSEMKIFLNIWQLRPHICQNCGKYINKFHSSCFPHILSKKMYPKWRYDPNNIGLVHGVFEQINESGETYKCHEELDYKMGRKKYEFEKLLELGDIEKINEFIKELG